MKNNIETEIKLYTPDLHPIKKRLLFLGARQIQERTHEFNLRFDHPELELAEKRVVLRLRQDQQSTLTYKDNAIWTDGIISRFEAEVNVGDFANTKLILEKLGFMVTASYEKYRSTFSLANTEIVLDELPFGNFVEIEGLPEDIQQSVDRLALSHAPRINYSYLQLFSFCQSWAKNALDLEIKNFRFEEFTNIVIPLKVLTVPLDFNKLE